MVEELGFDSVEVMKMLSIFMDLPPEIRGSFG